MTNTGKSKRSATPAQKPVEKDDPPEGFDPTVVTNGGKR